MPSSAPLPLLLAPMTGQASRRSVAVHPIAEWTAWARSLRVAGYRVDPARLAEQLLRHGGAIVQDAFGQDVSVQAPPGEDIDLLVVSGLSPVEADPWQAWLEARLPHALWVRPQDGDWPDVDRWCARIDAALARCRRGACLALAHGFGALALVLHASRGRHAPDAAILVAPADPARFGHDAASIGHALPFPTTLIALQGGAHPGSPWLQDEAARDWAARWRAVVVDAGEGPGREPDPWPEGEALLAAPCRPLRGPDRGAGAPGGSALRAAPAACRWAPAARPSPPRASGGWRRSG